MVGTTRSARVELRMTPEEKELLAAAAAREHLDVTSFVLRRVLPAAEEILADRHRIVLSERDARRLMEYLDNPPPPTPGMIAAAARALSGTFDFDIPPRQS
ncbi:MAG: DUF1778 domain-containing protein [Chloroflexi bacterium]|nr:DUF1778 domain-containing protein [Chloroflexota bacterium]